MTAYCPDCEGELQDEAFGYWCLACEAAVTNDRVAAEGA